MKDKKQAFCPAEDGTIMQLQNLSVNDGEGIRTIVFLAGCPLRCAWCANPEGQTRDNGMVRRATVDEIASEIAEQEIFYRFSGGGVTFSGGEPGMQPAFLNCLSGRLYDEGYHLAMESCGFFDFEAVRPTLERLDQIFMDIKHMDPALHRHFTGRSNQRILENIRRTAALGIPLTIRVPVILGVNGTDEDLDRIFDFMAENLPDPELELLPYHRYGEGKYEKLGLPLPPASFGTPSEEQLSRWSQRARRMGIRTVSYR